MDTISNETRVNSKTLTRPLRVAPLMLLLGAIGCTSLQARAEKIILVYFDGNCPSAVSNFVVDADKAKNGNPAEQIVWQAVDENGEDDDTKVFTVYFHPFTTGAPIHANSGSNGKTNPPATVGNVPANVLYKYTIVGDGCTGQPLDPFIRVT